MELYILVAQLAVSELELAAPVDPYSKFFFGVSGKHVWGEIAGAVAKILYAKGLVESAEASSIDLSLAPELT